MPMYLDREDVLALLMEEADENVYHDVKRMNYIETDEDNIIARTKYDIGKVVYVPFVIYAITINDKGTKYAIRSLEHKNIDLMKTEEEIGDMITDEDIFDGIGRSEGEALADELIKKCF